MTCSLTDEQRKSGLLCRAMDCEACKKYRDNREDIVNKPAHYNIGKIQASDYIADQKLDYFDGNVVKYIARAKHKGTEPTDREKALWYVIRGMIDCIGIDSALKSVEVTLKHFKDEEVNEHTVRACHDSDFNGIRCLDDGERYGFFKSEEDQRPSSCTWIEKDEAYSLFEIFGMTQRKGFSRS